MELKRRSEVYLSQTSEPSLGMNWTVDIATRMGAKVIAERRRGYGRALKTGFAAAKGQIIVTIDADNTYPTSSIPEYIEELERG